jgi:hypothetical protein
LRSAADILTKIPVPSDSDKELHQIKMRCQNLHRDVEKLSEIYQSRLGRTEFKSSKFTVEYLTGSMARLGSRLLNSIASKVNDSIFVFYALRKTNNVLTKKIESLARKKSQLEHEIENLDLILQTSLRLDKIAKIDEIEEKT